MSDISGISGSSRLTSQIKISLEAAQKQRPVEVTAETTGIKQFEADMGQINHAFTLVKEIRTSLESALRDLSPN